MQQDTAKVASAACTPCRLVKMKCTREPDSEICNRCKRKNLTCVFETHRRGRKPGTKLRPKAERERMRATSLKEQSSTSHQLPMRSSGFNSLNLANTASTVESDQHDERSFASFGSRKQSSSPPRNHSPAESESATVPERLSASDTASPYGMRRKHGAAGTFSIANILNSDETPETSRAKKRRIDDATDPINRGLLDFPTAQGLFDNFLQYMNPFICQFDPKLHTFKYVRQRSSFLFSAILSASAKIFSKDLYPRLHDHVERLLCDILGSGQRSTEIVQGICVLTYWKEPGDARAWMLVGYAIRGAIEMGWHKLWSTHSPQPAWQTTLSETEALERRNVERTWLMLFVYDRSVSLQLGNPWMIQIDPFIRNSENWSQDVLAIPGSDHVLCAFVRLRALGSEIMDQFWKDPVATISPSIVKKEAALDQFKSDLDMWETKWYNVVGKASSSVCSHFLVRFYGAHFRLLIHSFGLQLSIATGTLSKQSLEICYLSSLEMLRLVVGRLAATSNLYYCQDSIHVMIAYATVTVIKILLSLPNELPSDAEDTILNLLREASQHFSHQYPSTNTSCYHQSRFLTKVIAQYQKAKLEGRAKLHQQQQRPETYTTTPNILPPISQLHTKSHQQNPCILPPPLPPAFQNPSTTSTPQSSPRLPLPSSQRNQQHLRNLQTFQSMDGLCNAFPLFTDNIVWEDMFASAGFNISSGAFVP